LEVAESGPGREAGDAEETGSEQQEDPAGLTRWDRIAKMEKLPSREWQRRREAGKQTGL